MNIFFIGGSPCSGKSSIAEVLSQKSNFYYFKVDDHLEKYTKLGAQKGYSICKKQLEMTAEQIWMRDPIIQCKEEIAFYREIFEFITNDLKQIQHENIITEGAAYLPELMGKIAISKNRYISITPSKEFQVSHYQKRQWVSRVLEGCSDKEQAFCNWMDRDALFANEVREQCRKEQYSNVVNDGMITFHTLVELVGAHFEIKV